MATRIKVSVDTSGPLFDGRAKAAVRAWLTDTKAEVAQIGVNEIHARLGSVLKHPTGTYQSRVITERARRFDDQVVTDQGFAGGIVYGPWLEGTSTRNTTTRFKGYKTFRKTRLRLRKLVVPTAQAKLDRYLARMNG